VSKSKHRRRWTLESRKPASFPFPTDRELVWVCVGSDRSTGDSLGPFVGTMLTEAGVPNVYGTIDHPVHALNLAKTLERIKEAHPNACIVGIDACLGKTKSVGAMELRDGALEPGVGMGKVLPSFGDYNIIGVVNAEGFMKYEVLRSTRLSVVIQMAKSITDFILRSLGTRATEQVAATIEAEKGSTTEKRDLEADLELCNKATPGPWVFNGISVLGAHGLLIARTPNDVDAEFIAQAREGWPHAIERALETEALAQKLLDVLGRVIPSHLVGRLELDLDSVLEANGLLKKAEEVPGDE